MGTRVEQSSEFLPRASRTSRRHLEDMADPLHRLPSAAEDLQVIIPRCNRTLLLQREFCITLLLSPCESAFLIVVNRQGDSSPRYVAGTSPRGSAASGDHASGHITRPST